MRKYKTGAAELKDLIQEVLHHPDFKPQDVQVDHDMHEQLMNCIAEDEKGEHILACDANGSVTCQMAQEHINPGEVPISIVLYIDWTFMKRGMLCISIYIMVYNLLCTSIYIMIYDMLYIMVCIMTCISIHIMLHSIHC